MRSEDLYSAIRAYEQTLPLEVINHLNNMTSEKKTRAPRSVEAITKGAMGLTLAERVTLRNDLTASIDTEIKNLEQAAADAKALVKQ